MTPTPAGDGPGLARTRGGQPSPADRVRLRAGLGEVLRAERAARGRSQRWLARATGAHRTTIWRVESGLRRPSRMLLATVASVLEPDDPGSLRERLLAAAGGDLVPDVPWRVAHWLRVSGRAVVRGDRPLPAKLARSIELHAGAAAAAERGRAVLDAPGALDDPAALEQAAALLEEARLLRAQAGPAGALYVAGRLVASWGWSR